MESILLEFTKKTVFEMLKGVITSYNKYWADLRQNMLPNKQPDYLLV